MLGVNTSIEGRDQPRPMSFGAKLGVWKHNCRLPAGAHTDKQQV